MRFKDELASEVKLLCSESTSVAGWLGIAIVLKMQQCTGRTPGMDVEYTIALLKEPAERHARFSKR